MNRQLATCFTVMLATAAPAVQPHDRWDLGSGFCTSDDAVADTCNQLIHGQAQEHDVEAASPARDVDLMVVETKARHSYEVRVFNASTATGFTAGQPPGGGFSLNRVDAMETVLTQSFAPDGPLVFTDVGGWIAVRWIGDSINQRDYIRVEGKDFANPDSNHRYFIELLDTTYFIPRFNNSGSQATVFLIQNTTAAPVSGSIYFYSAAGVHLHTQPLSLAVHGLQVLSTSSIGALAGTSGSATIAHDGCYGALAAKAVALEATTGFSFDTIAMPVPR
jgi:hypothetical protein